MSITTPRICGACHLPEQYHFNACCPLDGGRFAEPHPEPLCMAPWDGDRAVMCTRPARHADALCRAGLNGNVLEFYSKDRAR